MVSPHVYHSGFNHGFNIAESAAFATPRWIPYRLTWSNCSCPSAQQIKVDKRIFERTLRSWLNTPERISLKGDMDHGCGNETAALLNVRVLSSHAKPESIIQHLHEVAKAFTDSDCCKEAAARLIEHTGLDAADRRSKQSPVRLHRPATEDTLARWVKTSRGSAGIDTNQYTAHSTRAGATTTARLRGVDVSKILRAARWSRAMKFHKHYFLLPATTAMSSARAVLNVRLQNRYLLSVNEGTRRRGIRQPRLLMQ